MRGHFRVIVWGLIFAALGAVWGDTFTNKETGKVVKGTLLGTTTVEGERHYLVKLEDGQQRRLPVSAWDVYREPKPATEPVKPEPKPATEGVKEEAKPTSEPVEVGIWEGFREIAWGTNIKKIEGLELVKEHRATRISRVGRGRLAICDAPSSTHFYNRAGDKLMIGAAPLTRVHYGFYKDRFASVFIASVGKGYLDTSETSEALKSAVFATFGRGECLEKDSRFEVWGWGWKSPSGIKGVYMALSSDFVTHTVTLLLQYQHSLDEEQRDKREALSKAKKDF